MSLKEATLFYIEGWVIKMPKPLSNDKLKKIIADNIWRAMEEVGLNQNQLAAEMGTTRAVVGRWINADNPPRMASIARLSNKLGVGPEYFFRDR